MDYDPTTKRTEFFSYDELTDKVTIRTETDVTDIVEENKALYNAVNERTRFGEMTKVASIPMTLYAELSKSGKLFDQAYMKRWLNDPDNRVFRTRPGTM